MRYSLKKDFIQNNYINDLEQKIIYHRKKYYAGLAEISDEKYDALELELKKLSPKSPILSSVGAVADSSNKTIKHQKKMLSLEKTYDVSNVITWMNNETVISMLKYDGSACSLIYNNGELFLAKTRGDGESGEEITDKCRFIPEIPRTLGSNSKIATKNTEIEIRGEIYCKLNDFLLLAERMKKLNLPEPSSQRNIVAGLLGRKGNAELCMYLSFVAFEIIVNEEILLTEEDKIKELYHLGFKIPEWSKCTTKSDIEVEIEKLKDKSQEGELLVDGLVFTYNNLRLHSELGNTSHHPRYKLAFKLVGESKETTIKEISWSISRNGVMTPVAIVEPVELSGAIVERVTLHNYGVVQNFKLKKNDIIEIVRSGEVIPKFLRVVSSAKKFNHHEQNDFYIPESCYVCGEKLHVDDIWLSCENQQCPGIIKEKILYFIKKIGMEDISEKRLDEMFQKKLIQSVSDLYKLRESDFLKLTNVKEKLAAKFFKTIQDSKNISLEKLIVALGITGLGEQKVKKIIEHECNTLEKWQNISLQDLEQIEGFAQKSSKQIIKEIKLNIPLINQLLEQGMIINKDSGIVQQISNKLAGKKFCLTGTLSQKREDVEALIRSHAGIIQDQVNKTTNYLVTNDTQSSSSKFKKAQQLKTPIISQDQLESMLK